MLLRTSRGVGLRRTLTTLPTMIFFTLRLSSASKNVKLYGISSSPKMQRELLTSALRHVEQLLLRTLAMRLRLLDGSAPKSANFLIAAHPATSTRLPEAHLRGVEPLPTNPKTQTCLK